MIVWRISNRATLDGGGGLRASARWHSKGCRLVYCAPNPATALLEMLVHSELEPADLPSDYQLLKIEVPDDIPYETVDPQLLPAAWKTNNAITRQVGDAWLSTGRTALLYVPCIIVPETVNVLINPAHPDSSRIRIINSQQYSLDKRLP
jgi:RES domain-containing protein